MSPKFRPHPNRLLLVLILFVAVSMCIYVFVNRNAHSPYTLEAIKLDNAIDCYKPPKFSADDSLNHSSIRYLDDILDGEKQPTPGKTIFFHETTCSKTGIISLNAKQACAIESAARLNPNHDIFVLFVSPVGLRDNETLPEYYDNLRLFPNVHFRNVNLWRYSHGTILFDRLSTNELFDSSYLFEHMSDIVRSLSLFRYGGYHVDLDVIVQRNFDGLGENFLGDDWGDVINGAIMHMNNHGIGREVLRHFFKEVIDSFVGSEFIGNGPIMLTRIYERICKTKDRTQWTRQQCQGAAILPKENFFPISWSDFMMYFEPSNLDEALRRTTNSTVIHVWNDRSASIWNKVGTNNAYQFKAKQNCPTAYEASEYF